VDCGRGGGIGDVSDDERRAALPRPMASMMGAGSATSGSPAASLHALNIACSDEKKLPCSSNTCDVSGANERNDVIHTHGRGQSGMVAGSTYVHERLVQHGLELGIQHQ
jgi:hypothetical protein